MEKDKFSIFDRERVRAAPGISRESLGVFALLSKYFNGYDDQRMELALDCRAEEAGSSVQGRFRRSPAVSEPQEPEEKLYQLLTEGIPAMQKAGDRLHFPGDQTDACNKNAEYPAGNITVSRASESGYRCGRHGSGTAF